MLDFEQLSRSYRTASFLGLITGFSFFRSLTGSSEFTNEALVILVFSILFIILSYILYLRHQNITRNILKRFSGIEEVAIGTPTIKMFFQFARTPKEKIRALEATYTLFWCGYFGLGMGLILVFADYDQGNLIENKMHIFVGVLLFLVLIVMKHLIFLWDIPYLEKLYHENIQDKDRTDVPTSEIAKHADSEQAVLRKGAKRGLFLRYVFILVLSFPGYWLAEIYLGFVRANYTVDAGFDRSLFFLIIPTVFIVAVNYFERWALWERVSWFDLKGVDHMVPITMGLAIGYVLSLGLMRLGIMFIESF